MVIETSRSTGGRIAAGAFGGLKANSTARVTERQIDAINLNAATALLQEAAAQRGGGSLVVIDEFENLPSVEDRHFLQS